MSDEQLNEEQAKELVDKWEKEVAIPNTLGLLGHRLMCLEDKLTALDQFVVDTFKLLEKVMRDLNTKVETLEKLTPLSTAPSKNGSWD